MRILLPFSLLPLGVIIAGCTTPKFLPKHSQFVEVAVDHVSVFSGKSSFRLQSPDSIGVLSRKQFNDRFMRMRGHSQFLYFMDSAGYEFKERFALSPFIFPNFQRGTYYMIFEKRK